MKRKKLTQKFFTRPTLQVAHDLLGKFLVHKIGKEEIAVMLTEVEAYDGPRDRASHASRGMTGRNAVMFGAGGYFYVYLCYGMYEMLNIVTGPQDYPAAILLRGAVPSPFQGGVGGGLAPLLSKEGSGGGFLNGPGKLTKFLQVDRRFNKKIAAKKTGLWFEDRGVTISDRMIRRTPRIGVAYAGPIWSRKKYRFLLTKTEK
jgi:DNA-3-methyladenine glycosylase